MSFPNAKQDEPQVPPPAHIEPVSLGLPDGDRGVESFSSMFSDCGFLVNDATKRRSVLSSKSKPQDRYSFLSFTHEDPLELSDLGYRNSQFVRLPDEDRDLESPSTLVEKDNFDYQDGFQLARLPPVEGTKLWSLMIVLFIALLLSTLEQLIVGTALTSISSDLGQYDKSIWVVTAYLMTYNGFLIVLARCGDIFGRRSAFMIALIIFTIASLACGVAQTMTQLIVFRAFQGIGGAGLFTLTLSVATEIPGKARTIVQVLIPAAFGISAGGAPVIGGAIVSNTTWRWVFLLNVPIGVVLIGVALWAFPKNAVPLKITFGTLAQIDWPGTVLFLAAVFSLNFALQEGGTQYAWNSGAIVSTLVIQTVCWVALVYWEINLTSKGSRTRMLPIWPSRLFSGRVIGCAMLAAFFSGIPLYSIYIYLPQRFQIENGLSPLSAGIHLLLVPLVCFMATGLGSSICLVINITFPLLVAAMALQCLALGLMTTLPSTVGIPARLYGYETILGFGFGLALPTISTIARMELSHVDHSVNMAAISSLRSLGGTIGLAIGNIVLSSRVWNKLSPILSPDQVTLVIQSPEKITQFKPDQIRFVRETFGLGFNFNTKVTLFFAIAAFVACLGCFVRHPMQIRDMDEADTKAKALLDKQALDKAAEGG